MRLIRWILVFALVLGCTLTGWVPPIGSHELSLQAMLTPAIPSATPAPPLSALQLDVPRLQQTLDRGDVTAAVQQVEVGWKHQYEAYYQGQLTSQLFSSHQIARRLKQIADLTNRKTALVYAISTPEHLELMLVSPDQRPIHRRVIAANKATLIQTINTFRLGIVNSTSQPSDYLPAAQQLYQWMIAPLEFELQTQQINTLIFCLGGGLRSLPMAALHDGTQFLVEKYSFAIIPAFNLLDQRPDSLSETKVLAMGSSEFPQAAPLPAVPAELIAINRLWEGESWLNQDFTVDHLKARRSHYPFGIVHLATHASFEPGSVDASYIQFWNSQLQLNYLRELGLRQPVVQLLVLSACRTALGDPNAELGFAGLAVESGAKAALASLWSVSDTGTLLLMINFYQNLKTASIKAEALQQAQIAMLRGHAVRQSRSVIQTIPADLLPSELQAANPVDFSHPYYWAAFTVIGSPW